MQKFSFYHLEFLVNDEDRLMLTRGFDMPEVDEAAIKTSPIVEVQLAGVNHGVDGAHRMVGTCEASALRYTGHTINGDTLEITQKSPRLEVTTVFQAYGDSNAIRIFSRVKNISDEDQVLTAASAFALRGFGPGG